jgi:iron-sulfur cluster repair protein YtfE (RIC family)
MEDKKVKVRELLSYLTKEHKVLLEKANQLEKDLEKEVNLENVNKALDFINIDIEKHSKMEEIDLDKALQEAGIDFDIEALNFGHQTLNEIGEHFEYLADLFKKGETTYMNRDIKSELQKTFKEYSQTLKDHFLEEENFFFPDILKYDIERFE